MAEEFWLTVQDHVQSSRATENKQPASGDQHWPYGTPTDRQTDGRTDRL